MSAPEKKIPWPQANLRHLHACVDLVEKRLQRFVALRAGQTPDESILAVAQEEVKDAEAALEFPSALQYLVDHFQLTAFERDLIIFAGAGELGHNLRALCEAAETFSFATFSLASKFLPGAEWESISSAAPLRRWRLIEIGSGSALLNAVLSVDENILFYLLGVPYEDRRLAGIIEPLWEPEGELAPSHEALARQLAGAWNESALPAVLQLCGPNRSAKTAIAARVCRLRSLNLHRLRSNTLPSVPADLYSLAQLWNREARLKRSGLLIQGSESKSAEEAREHSLDAFVEQVEGFVILATEDRRLEADRPTLSFDVKAPTIEEQRALWKNVLENAGAPFDARLDGLVYQFNLEFSSIHAVAQAALGQCRQAPEKPNFETLAAALWETARTQARSRLNHLAQRIEPEAGWEDLILPPAQLKLLLEICVQARQRHKVYEAWGFAAKGGRNLGISAVFAGASGVGKTLAAEVIARELSLDLYRIDLSSVVNKYIGETEKNLRRIFDAAEQSGAILLFDEADALFGKRTEVKDSHDRFANIEVSYLLQRIESYRGLAILTTNLQEAMDTAFMRRLRFIVQFPFPDAAQREAIWKRTIPAALHNKDIHFKKLANLNASGGTIRNIAIGAASSAAQEDRPLHMAHFHRAALLEANKLGKPLTPMETSGWI